jgi:hypothetical protein
MTTFIPPTPRNPASHAVRKAIRALPLLVATVSLTGLAAAADVPRRSDPAARQATGRTVVDHAVQPAGGACKQCGPGACRHGHHRDCRDGACVPYCPVRPSTFGYYGTQWRRWPGSGVVPVSNEQAATPVKPPKSAVPGADEESFGPPPSDLPEPDFPAADAPSPSAPEPPTADSEPLGGSTERSDDQPATRPAPAPEADTAPAQPEAAPAKPRPADDNLFDESAARKVRRKIPVPANPMPAQRSAKGRVQPAAHQEPAAAAKRPAMKPVPRVAFDPRLETTRPRQAAQ